MDYRTEAPEIIKSFLIYHETIKGHSPKTVEEYYLDLRTFFRFLKVRRRLVDKNTEFKDISIKDVDLALVKSVTITDIYEFMNYSITDRSNSAKISAAEMPNMVPWPRPVRARFQPCEASINILPLRQSFWTLILCRISTYRKSRISCRGTLLCRRRRPSSPLLTEKTKSVITVYCVYF